MSVRDKETGWICTYTGQKFNLFDPAVDQVSIIDIAHALSLINRFTGHTKYPYSVAQHSVYASMYCDTGYELECLLHDSPEAYLNDLARPLKRDARLAAYRSVEQTIWITIAVRFGLPTTQSKQVKAVDRLLVGTEAHQLLPKLHKDWTYSDGLTDLSIEPWSALEAECAFYRRFLELVDV